MAVTLSKIPINGLLNDSRNFLDVFCSVAVSARDRGFGADLACELQSSKYMYRSNSDTPNTVTTCHQTYDNTTYFSSTAIMLFFSFFKTLVNHEVTVELKNDISIRGTLKSVDQYLNIKLDDITVVDELKFPHLVSTKHDETREAHEYMGQHLV